MNPEEREDVEYEMNREFDGPPCDVDPVAHEERLAYLEPDDGQD
jgi:hypothetical protein